MNSISNELDRIREDIIEQVRYPFMERYIHLQHIPQSFLRVLYLMLRSRSLPQDRIHLYCMTATLMQMGLSIHETVTTRRETHRDRIRSRQLTVLAGDYMSSLFYKNLSTRGEVDGVAHLSKAICEINEAKMELYNLGNQSTFSWPDVLRLTKKISGGLVTQLSYFFMDESDEENVWDPLAENLLVLTEWQNFPAPASDMMAGVPSHLIRSLAADTCQQVRRVRPLEVRHALTEWLRESVMPRFDESLVREG
ncbi:MAG: heptaprenyl diphosphate synthase component 1 [Firmicutes bacterium]|nr:heptaprenyl diphosphate synthase component 1 [Bacillota bacterium]